MVGNAKAEKLMEQARIISTPNHRWYHPGIEDCGKPAPIYVRDDWGDSCEGYPCIRETGHIGQCMCNDGANGYEYWN